MSNDLINKPAHYIEGREIEPIQVIEDWNLDYHLGQVLKYVSRAGRKQQFGSRLKESYLVFRQKDMERRG